MVNDDVFFLLVSHPQVYRNSVGLKIFTFLFYNLCHLHISFLTFQLKLPKVFIWYAPSFLQE